MASLSQIKRSVSDKTPYKVAVICLFIIAVLCMAERGFSQQSDTITYTYDSLNRLTGIIYSSGPALIYTYDAAGNRLSVQVTGGVTFPLITSLNPTSANVGGSAFTLTVNGGFFPPNAAVQWNGASRPTTFVSSTQLTANIPATDIAALNPVNITVVNPSGGVSNAVAFTISNGSPTPTPTPTPTPRPTPSLGADLALSTTVSPNPVVVNNNLTFTSTVTNNGSAAASGAIFVSTFPVGTFGVNFVSATTSQGTCSLNISSAFQVTHIDLPISHLPEQFPSDIPLEESGNTVTQNYLAAANNGGFQATRVFVTTRGLDDAIAIYQNYFTNHGWVIQSSSSLDGLRSLSASKNGGSILVSINENSITHIRTISISLTSPGLICNLADLSSNTSATITVVGKPTVPGIFTNLSNVFSSIVDPNLNNNSVALTALVLTDSPTSAPVLLTEENSARAIALDSVTNLRDPFSLNTIYNFSPDQRTRLALFAINLNLQPGENSSAVTAQAVDSQQRVYPLTVEYVGKVSNFDWLSHIVVRLPDGLPTNGDVLVSVSLHGNVSNKVWIGMKP